MFFQKLSRKIKRNRFENIPEDYKKIAESKIDKNLEKSLGKNKI